MDVLPKVGVSVIYLELASKNIITMEMEIHTGKVTMMMTVAMTMLLLLKLLKNVLPN
jgi:hypothetical protein